MCTGLVGHDIGNLPHANQFGKNIGCIADQSNRTGLPGTDPLIDFLKSFRKAVTDFIYIAGFKPLLYSAFIHIDTEKSGPIHGGCQRLCTTHAAQSGGQYPPSRETSAKMPVGHG